MKKTVLLLFALVLSSLVEGQVIKTVGVKSGISVANQAWRIKTDNRLLDTESRIGFYGVVSMAFLKSKYFSLNTDLGYYTKGSTQRVLNTSIAMPEGDGTFSTFDTRLDYVVFSPMLRARYEVGPFIPYALLGLRVDYQWSYRSDFSDQVVPNDFRRIIWGSSTGAGVEYRFKQIGLLVEGQYHHDFSRLIDTQPSANQAGLEVKNSALVWCVGLKHYLP